MNSPITRIRVANACDVCKQRKVKCDGNLPCGYCKSRQRSSTCHFSPTARRRVRKPHLPSPESSGAQSSVPSSARPEASPDIPDITAAPVAPVAPVAPIPSVTSSRTSDDLTHRSYVSAEEEADVPREARLLCDAGGKLIFVGDCAPLSLFQTVRQIVTSRVDPNAFTPQTSRVSMLENASSDPLVSTNGKVPHVDPTGIKRLVSVFLSVTSGLIDLFENDHLADNISAWTTNTANPHDTTSAVNYLVLAIGSQSVDEGSAAEYFQYAKTLALSCLGGDLGIETVQAFALVTLYMLRACQINGSFLFFGIAARAAYSIGLHRTEVNSRFGSETHIRRDRLWKSLRVLDLFLSISMGRPPSMSDIDCTVPYRTLDSNGQEEFDILNASVQVLSITEEIVLQVYSRRKISLQLTEGISRRLRDWSNRWLPRLKRTMAESPREYEVPVVGACQVMSCYYYAVMLVTRPFLMYEICLMAESVVDLVNQRRLDGRMPLIVQVDSDHLQSSWLFASSLVLGVGLLGGFGRILEKYAHMSIAALEYLAEHDAHAMQYSLIAKSLLSSALKYLQRKDMDERLRITETSSQLFGLIPKEHPPQGDFIPTNSSLTHELLASPFHDIDPALLSLGCSLDSTSGNFLGRDQQDQTDHVFGALNLFPLLDGNGHIDLAHYL
ncbi:hypothetical protein M434DRAFT_73907 [Hypoxylon sp. CO27-5]|nr:hypothetical protein M434DRAFT_73907 [Hypoxylon sp. CO27-5]